MEIFAENDETIAITSELKDVVNSSLMTTDEISQIYRQLTKVLLSLVRQKKK